MSEGRGHSTGSVLLAFLAGAARATREAFVEPSR